MFIVMQFIVTNLRRQLRVLLTNLSTIYYLLTGLSMVT